jgi:hypothetical protein
MGMWHYAEIGEEISAVLQIAAREFAADERMHQDPTFRQEIDQLGLSITKVSDPDGSVYENHQAERRLGMSPSFGCVPPRAARRLLASREMSASRPARTSEVLSLIPVASLARSSRVSSMTMVVRICISMHH